MTAGGVFDLTTAEHILEKLRAEVESFKADETARHEVGIPRSQLSEALSDAYETSPFVEPIHAYLGWSPPPPPTAALDAGETVNGYLRMAPLDRELMDAAFSVLRGVQGDQAKRALVEFLRLCRSY